MPLYLTGSLVLGQTLNLGMSYLDTPLTRQPANSEQKAMRYNAHVRGRSPF